MTRPSFDEVAFQLTRTIAQRSTCPRLHTAAVIMTPDHRLVASGYNGSLPGLEHCSTESVCTYCANGREYYQVLLRDNPAGHAGQPCRHCGGTRQMTNCLMVEGHCQRTVHAEANAIAQAAKYGPPLNGCHIYVLNQPCLPCTKLIVASGIVAIHYDQPYRTDDESSKIARQFLADSYIELHATKE